VSATFQFTLYKMVGVETMQEEEKKTKKRENFRWSDEMVEQLDRFFKRIQNRDGIQRPRL
jgi:hypothetical protein